mmetsp:Transcript_74265/g.174345  ORF Transcript_74265/g.174345 Transcript_74265/m.174345 type:complete len:136 (+) Transcript_74265:34-441(+)
MANPYQQMPPSAPQAPYAQQAPQPYAQTPPQYGAPPPQQPYGQPPPGQYQQMPPQQQQQVLVSYQSGNWTNGLCDCLDDIGFCCLSWLCPCVAYGQNKQLQGDDCMGAVCCYLVASFFGVAMCVAGSNRGDLRAR